MNKIIVVLLSVFLVNIGFSQTKNPVSFTYQAVKKNATTYEIVITANLEKTWHIYSQNTDAGGPVPTKITFKPNPLVKLSGKIAEKGKMLKVKDKNFNVNVMYYSDKVQFIQTVTVKANTKTNITGTVDYMVCDDEKCLPPKKVSFEVKL